MHSEESVTAAWLKANWQATVIDFSITQPISICYSFFVLWLIYRIQKLTQKYIAEADAHRLFNDLDEGTAWVSATNRRERVGSRIRKPSPQNKYVVDEKPDEGRSRGRSKTSRSRRPSRSPRVMDAFFDTHEACTRLVTPESLEGPQQGPHATTRVRTFTSADVSDMLELPGEEESTDGECPGGRRSRERMGRPSKDDRQGSEQVFAPVRHTEETRVRVIGSGLTVGEEDRLFDVCRE
jgi:hypothetical protein